MTNVLVTDDGPVRVVMLNRPEVRNAIDIPLRIELAEALETADADSSVRALVLTGAGGTFCSGGDISTMRRMPHDAATERAQMAQRIIRAIWNTPKPVLAAVEGAAYGAGAALAAACDRVVAGRAAKFATTFLNVGLAGDMGAYASLPGRMGMARARQMLMMAEPLTAEDALPLGLIDAVVGTGESLAEAVSDAHRLAGLPAGALATMKEMLATAPTRHRLEVLELEVEQQAALFDSDDFAEGIAAFHEKRPAVFGGVGSHPRKVAR
ncbi:enoyl-CoA hydratase [Mycolicibacterium porcinum]|uniref:enoyl-CoA hydratase/isomerase family protein n=1 Tax=Mycolicibacterium porcinum TaxID=39693 RepID=UPI0011935BB3|nr:enoyl-CoA hydratase-related protein [Mycolicibacterium porcinum]TVX95983.1 enoyl-CoA hydratase [Mycolicibacterium porcinum]